MALDQTTIAFGLIIIALLVSLIWIIRLELRLNRFWRGREGVNLESIILKLRQEVETVDKTNKEIQKYLIDMERRLKQSVQHVKTIRFNPFREQGQGSNQSFATALLDEQGNGTVISTLYSRDKVSVYAKPIKNYHSEFEITEEEKIVLAK